MARTTWCAIRADRRSRANRRAVLGAEVVVARLAETAEWPEPECIVVAAMGLNMVADVRGLVPNRIVDPCYRGGGTPSGGN